MHSDAGNAAETCTSDYTEFSKAPLNSLNLFSGEKRWKDISSVPRRSTSNHAFVIKRRSNGNLDELDNVL